MNAPVDRDRGTTSIFLVIIALAVITAAGLALDGGRKLAALSEARSVAGNAARSCAQAVQPASADAGQLVLDPNLGAGRAEAMATGGTSVEAVVTGATCVVTATRTVDFRILPGSTTVSARSSAEALLAP